jgi:hypothetical protein
MVKKKKAEEVEGAIYGGEEEVVILDDKPKKKKTAAKPAKAPDLIKMHGFQRAMIDGRPHILVMNVCNQIWGCVEEARGKPSHVFQAAEMKVYQVDRTQLLR